MLLSNPFKYFLLVCFIALSLQACGSSQSNENRPANIIVPTTGEFPFSTKEPEIYQAELTVDSGAFRDKWVVARKKASWRIDFFDNGEPSRTQLNSDAVYLIDHKRKIFTTNAGTGDPVNELTDQFFKGKEYRKFEETSREGSVVKYKIARTNGKGDVLISVDEETGVMMRQEFAASGEGAIAFVYEVKDLKLEVDDSVFQIPAGYKKVTWNEFQTPPKQAK